VESGREWNDWPQANSLESTGGIISLMPKGRITGLNSPYRRMPGHINSQYFQPTSGWVVLYQTARTRVPLEAARGKYAVICEAHGRLTQHFTRDVARRFQTHPELFCPDCKTSVKNPPVKIHKS